MELWYKKFKTFKMKSFLKISIFIEIVEQTLLKISLKKSKIWLIQLDFTTPFSIIFLITWEYYNTFVLNMSLLFDNHEVFQIKIEFFSSHEKKYKNSPNFLKCFFSRKFLTPKSWRAFNLLSSVVKIPHNFILIHFFISANFIWIMRLNQQSKINNK